MTTITTIKDTKKECREGRCTRWTRDHVSYCANKGLATCHHMLGLSPCGNEPMMGSKSCRQCARPHEMEEHRAFIQSIDFDLVPRQEVQR